MKKNPEIDTLLATLNASVLKRYGQNFLVDVAVIEATFQAAAIQPGQTILEIGPGLGALTAQVPFDTTRYISYEIDRSYHAYLSQKFPLHTTHHLGSFLKATPEKVDIILGNLPYYITSDIFEKIFKDFSSFQRGVFLIQKEVIGRLIGQPGTEHYGPLAILIAVLGNVHILRDVEPASFYPEPHVNSTLFWLERHPTLPVEDTRAFFYFLKKLFLNRRKNVINNLGFVALEKEGILKTLSSLKIEENRRPEALTVEEIIALYHSFLGKMKL